MLSDAILKKDENLPLYFFSLNWKKSKSVLICQSGLKIKFLLKNVFAVHICTYLHDDDYILFTKSVYMLEYKQQVWHTFNLIGVTWQK